MKGIVVCYDSTVRRELRLMVRIITSRRVISFSCQSLLKPNSSFIKFL